MKVFKYRRRLLEHGGIEKYVSRVAANMVERGSQVALAAATISERFEFDPRVRRVDAPQVHTPLGAYSPRMVSAVLRFRPNVVHVHSLSSLSSMAQLTGPWTRVVTPYFHGDILDSPGEDRWRTRCRVVVRWANALVFMNDDERALFADFVGHKIRHAVVVPPGVDPPTETEGDRRRITAIARLVPYKRLDLVVQAAHRAGLLSELRIVGHGSEYETLRRDVAALGGDPDLVVIGKLDDQALQQLLARTKVLVSMSESESYGITLAEGIAAGAAVVASDIPAHRQVLRAVPDRHYAIVPLELVALATVFAAPPEAPVAGQYARTWACVADELLELYRSLRH